MVELAYVYVDCGDSRYKVLTHEMVQSAKRVMPDIKLTQISDKKTPKHPDADGMFLVDTDCQKEQVTTFKGYFQAEFAKQCQQPLILCDVDMIWNRPLIFQEQELHKLGVLYRETMPSMPINTGMILSTPGAKSLWEKYQSIVSNMQANGIEHWYTDQLAAAIAWLSERQVRRLDMQSYAYAPDGPDDRGDSPYAYHLKGNRKQWLMNFLKAA